MSKSFVSVLCAMFLFLGVIIGFLWAPVKKGISCGNYNGSNNRGRCWDNGEEPVADESDDLPF